MDEKLWDLTFRNLPRRKASKLEEMVLLKNLHHPTRREIYEVNRDANPNVELVVFHLTDAQMLTLLGLAVKEFPLVLFYIQGKR